jgi:putative NADH-flavin reductase
MQMKLAIFGASGRTGQHVVEQALAAGHEVVAFARTPSKLGIQHERLSTVQGDVADPAAVEKAVAGVDAVVSVLGPNDNSPEMKVSKGTVHILAAMKKHGVHRLVASAGAGILDANDSPTFLNKFIGWLVKTTSRNVYKDMRQTVNLIRNSDRQWTLVRVPMLTDKPKTGRTKASWVGKGMGMQLTRADMADFMLRQVADATYVRQAPAVSN